MHDIMVLGVLMKIQKPILPKKGDKVDGGYEGRALKNGSNMGKYGIIHEVSKGWAYVNYGLGSYQPILLSDLKPISKGIWKD